MALYSIERVRLTDSSSGGFINDTKDVEAGDGTSILGGLSLVVVEVRWHGNDSLLNLLTQLGFGDLFHLLEREQNARSMNKTPGRTFVKTMEEISWGENFLVSPMYSTWT